MKSRLAARKLQDLDSALAIDNALDSPLQIFKSDSVHPLLARRICIACGTGKVAGMNDLDQCKAGGESFTLPCVLQKSVPPQYAAGDAVARGTSLTAEIGIPMITSGKPIETGVTCKTCFRSAVLQTAPRKPNARFSFLGALPDFCRTRGVTEGTLRYGPLQQGFCSE